ncbi:hypothetical protein D3C80_1418790 [compost metagenome]
MVHRLINAHAEGKRNGERNRHIHIHATGAQRIPGGNIENPARINQGRQRDQTGNPMKHIAGSSIRTRPDRNRQQHHIARRKGCNTKRDQQPREGRIFVLHHIENMRFITETAQRIDHIRRCLSILPANGDTTRCQVDADIGNTADFAERIFDCLDAKAAVNTGNREIELAQTIAERTTCNLHFIRRNGLNDGGYLCIFNAATHKILPSFTRTRMMWR